MLCRGAAGTEDLWKSMGSEYWIKPARRAIPGKLWALRNKIACLTSQRGDYLLQGIIAALADSYTSAVFNPEIRKLLL